MPSLRQFAAQREKKKYKKPANMSTDSRSASTQIVCSLV